MSTSHLSVLQVVVQHAEKIDFRSTPRDMTRECRTTKQRHVSPRLATLLCDQLRSNDMSRRHLTTRCKIMNQASLFAGNDVRAHSYSAAVMAVCIVRRRRQNQSKRPAIHFLYRWKCLFWKFKITAFLWSNILLLIGPPFYPEATGNVVEISSGPVFQ